MPKEILADDGDEESEIGNSEEDRNKESSRIASRRRWCRKRNNAEWTLNGRKPEANGAVSESTIKLRRTNWLRAGREERIR